MKRWPPILMVIVFGFAACSARKQVGKGNALQYAERAREINHVLTDVESKCLKTFVNEWLGVKYKYGGTDKTGVDCSGFAGALYKLVYGKKLARSSYDIAGTMFLTHEEPEEGDLLFFAFNSENINHVGIYLGNRYFIHSSTTRGVVIDNLNIPEFMRAFKGISKKN